MPRLFIAFAMALVLLVSAWTPPAQAQSIVSDLELEIRQRAAQIETKLIAWRRDIHEHPELGEQETRTAGVIAEHLTKLGLEVKTGVARTGVIAILKGSKPGPVVALRADMDALPVKEPEGLPFATAAQIVLGLQTVVSRRTDLMKSPTVVSVTTINGGSRFNIVPETVDMTGTIRTYDAGVRTAVHRDIRQIAENIALSANAKAEVEIIELYDPLVNDERVTARVVPVLERAANGDVVLNERSGASEDFSFMLNDVPGQFFFLGVVPRDQELATAAPNHSPNFFVDEKALVVGVRALAMATVNYLVAAKTD